MLCMRKHREGSRSGPFSNKVLALKEGNFMGVKFKIQNTTVSPWKLESKFGLSHPYQFNGFVA